MRYIQIILCGIIFFVSHVMASGQALQGYLVTNEAPLHGRTGVGMNGRGTWEINNYQNYVYTLEQVCYCALPKQARVYVVGGKVVQVVDIKTGRKYLDANTLNSFRPISGYLELIDEVVSKHPDNLSIKYNRYLGYPEVIKVDLSYRMSDEEIDYKISEFKFLKKQ